MRLVSLEQEVRVFLSEAEFNMLLDFAPDWETEIGVKIMAYTSLRRNVTVEVSLQDFYVPEDDGIKTVFVDVSGAKDTSDKSREGAAKHRIVWAPYELYQEVRKYTSENNIAEDEQLISVQKSQFGNRIKKMGEKAAEATGVEGYKHITTHDFRRYFANRMLRKYNVDKEMVKFLGDWSSDKAIEPYLAVPTYEEIQNELAYRGLLDVDIEPPERIEELEQIRKELREINRRLERDRIRRDVEAELTADQLEEIHEYLRHQPNPSAPEQTKLQSKEWYSNHNGETRKRMNGPVAAGVITYHSMTERVADGLLKTWKKTVDRSPLAWAKNTFRRRAALVGSLWIGEIMLLAALFIMSGTYIDTTAWDSGGNKIIIAMLLMTVIIAKITGKGNLLTDASHH